ncbi:NADH:flavin oxidoreductase/NADH oxidase [Gleimia sp. 6138-11-ORH1]|uniref:NADH:flavin oxidoreductase/NADH oxidase n=1 Tax=Gleimia sp. 6138-11-ORH1 TaxID=2973937 RepID=UPI0021699244|nr:NADH:flavin oxidoreductase/NADH oxidase [Gleimia sp. 6138-11-ORH1]MCS4483897.1 NADH:flavin oxidoreductase/NADH oxidase [Gleimia sp. 6138-11-ORH1]
MPALNDSLKLRNLVIPNRIWMPPMCMYSAVATGSDRGKPNDFHLAHYSARAAGGAGLLIVEATGVCPDGRITPWDLGLWDDQQIPAFSRLTTAIKAHGAVPAIQLAHAGRKAGTNRPWKHSEETEESRAAELASLKWVPVAPSPIAFPGLVTPQELDKAGIGSIVADFTSAAVRAVQAGFEVIEIHAAHGYLLHEFLSPLTNQRTDEYGGCFENRIRLLTEVVTSIRQAIGKDIPLFLRLSATDWVEENQRNEFAGAQLPAELEAAESWTVSQTIDLVRVVTSLGVDLIDCSTGGLIPITMDNSRSYQIEKAIRIKEATGACVAGVGRITDPLWAGSLVSAQQLDAVLVGRQLLADPTWPNRAFVKLGLAPFLRPQYAWATTVRHLGD